MYSFCNFSDSAIRQYIVERTFKKESFTTFCQSENNRLVATWLLNQEFRQIATLHGLRRDWKNKSVYFYPTEPDSPERHIAWESQARKAVDLLQRDSLLSH
jgi:hypothetical protein